MPGWPSACCSRPLSLVEATRPPPHPAHAATHASQALEPSNEKEVCAPKSSSPAILSLVGSMRTSVRICMGDKRRTTAHEMCDETSAIMRSGAKARGEFCELKVTAYQERTSGRRGGPRETARSAAPRRRNTHILGALGAAENHENVLLLGVHHNEACRRSTKLSQYSSHGRDSQVACACMRCGKSHST